MKELGINTISNIATRLWHIIAVYIFIPLYIKILGETSYGLIAFFSTMQITLNILGLGLSNTLRREFAVGEETEKNSIRKYKLLHNVEIIYLLIGIFIFFICDLYSIPIAEQWLNIENLSSNVVASVIALMGGSIAIQIISNLYVGCLFGLNKQVYANTICIVYSIIKNLGSLLIIAFIKSDLILFYSWHIFVDICYTFILRNSIIRKLKIKNKVKWTLKDLSMLKSVWQYTAGVLFISFIALINKQLDKVIISKYLSLTEFGAYNVATTLGGLCTIIPTAMYTAVFPRFTNYATTDNSPKIKKEFKFINKLINIIIATTGSFISVYSILIIRIWTRSTLYTEILGNVAVFVVLAVAFSEFQEIPYAFALAHGLTVYNVLLGLFSIPIVFFFTYLAITKWGLIGAGVVYMIMMFIQSILYEFLIFRRFIKEESSIMLIIKDTISPTCVSLLIAFGTKLLIGNINSHLLAVAFAVMCGGVTLIILFIVFCKGEIEEIVMLMHRNRRRKA